MIDIVNYIAKGSEDPLIFMIQRSQGYDLPIMSKGVETVGSANVHHRHLYMLIHTLIYVKY